MSSDSNDKSNENDKTKSRLDDNYTSFPILPEQQEEYRPLTSLLKSTLKKVTANATTAVQNYLPQVQSSPSSAKTSHLSLPGSIPDAVRNIKSEPVLNVGMKSFSGIDMTNVKTSASAILDTTPPPLTSNTSESKESATPENEIMSPMDDDSKGSDIASSTHVESKDSQLAINELDLTPSSEKTEFNDTTQINDTDSIAASFVSYNTDLPAAFSSSTFPNNGKLPKVKTDGRSLRISTIDLPKVKPQVQPVSAIKEVEDNASPVVTEFVGKNGSSLQKISNLFKNLPNDIELSDDSSDAETIDDSSFSIFGFKANLNPLKTGGISKQHWMEDALAVECLNCQRAFTAFRRKHHCRFCGQIFCNDCTLFVYRKRNPKEKIRVCKPCYNDVIVYLSDDDDEEEVKKSTSRRNSTSIRRVRSNLSMIKKEEEIGKKLRFDEDISFKRDPDGEADSIEEPSTPTRSLYRESSNNASAMRSPEGDNVVFTAPLPPPRMAIPTTRKGESVEIPVSRSFTGKAINSFANRRGRGFDLYSYYDKSKSSDALSIKSNSNLNLNLEEELSTDDEEDESESEDEQVMSLYTSLIQPKVDKDDDFIKDKKHHNFRSSERAHASLLRMRSRRKSKSVSRTKRSSSNLTNAMTADPFLPALKSNSSTSLLTNSNILNVNGQNTVIAAIEEAPLISQPVVKFSTPSRIIKTEFENYLHQILVQCLEDGEVQHRDEWVNILEPLLDKIDLVDINDTLDIKQYIKIKKIAGGRIRDTEVIDGMFMTKNVDLKNMASKVLEPKIALIMFPIEYLKNKEQFISLKLLSNQESVYVNNIVQKLINLKPDIVVAGDSVCGLAEKKLEASGISVISNVKPQVIERISRYTKADIFSTVNDLFFKVGTLGTCKIFEVKKYVHKDIIKTFLFFTGSSYESGFTIALRGGDEDLLTSIKYAVETMIFAKFNEKFEKKLFENQCVTFSEKTPEEVIETPGETSSLFAEDYINLSQKRALSVSPSVRFPLPYILKHVKEAEKRLLEFEKFNNKIQSSNSIDDLEPELVEKFNVLIDIDKLPKKNEDMLNIYKHISDLRLKSLQSTFNFRSRTWNNCMSYTSYQLYPVFHKNITFLYSMVSIRNYTPCVGPNTGNIDYYTDNDRCLGLFLDQILMEANQICEECGETHSNHFKSYVHGNGKLDVVLEKIHKIPSSVANDSQNKRLMWSYCKKCHTSTPMIKMSDETYCFSFGKYLELSFWSENVKVLNYSCSHDYFKDHIRYFGLNDLAIRIEYSQVETFEIVIPRKQLQYTPEKDVELKSETYSHIQEKSKKFFASILSRLNRVKLDTIDKVEAGLKRIEELKLKVEEQSKDLEIKVLDIYNSTLPSIHLPLNSVLRSLQELSVWWDNEFQDFEKQYLPSENDITRITQFQLKKFLMDKYSSDDESEVEMNDIPRERMNSGKEKKGFKEITDDSRTEIHEKHELAHNNEFTGASDQIHELINHEDIDELLPKNNVLDKVLKMEALLEHEKGHLNTSESSEQLVHKRILSGAVDNEVSSLKPLKVPAAKQNMPTSNILPTTSKIPVRQTSVTLKPKPGVTQASASTSMIPKSKEFEIQLNKARSASNSTKVMHLANLFDQMHFDQLSMEFELQREKERRKLSRRRANAVGSSKPIVEVYRKIEDAVNIEDEAGYSSDEGHQTTKSKRRMDIKKARLDKLDGYDSVNLNHSIKNIESIIDEEIASKRRKSNAEGEIEGDPEKTKVKDEGVVSESQKSAGGDSSSDQKVDIPQPEKISLLKTLTNFWADRSATLWAPLEYPLSASEHAFVDSDVIVREDEPSSLVAFCLSSNDYKQKIKQMKENDTEPLNVLNEIHKKKQASFAKMEKKFKASESSKGELESIMGKLNTTHLKYQYLDGQSNLSCRIFYSEQFEAFRKACHYDENFVQSLSRCVKWDSSGGKSGSSFLKTLDNRFIIKELSKSELESFVAIAPFYFKYMSQSIFNTLTTAIAKIFGFYQIHIKNPITGKNFKMDFLIMENLFYNRKTSRIFDLKGSMRNRHVEQTGKENEVLLDENMVEFIYESPLFVREHSKRLLRGSLFNDTAFLSSMDVMDYSLVVGIDDSDNKKLYVGIIDCIRTFTWDKRVENWVKGTHLIGGGKGKDPTIVTPKQYRTRFREAMERYILEVPDCWYEGKHDRVVNY